MSNVLKSALFISITCVISLSAVTHATQDNKFSEYSKKQKLTYKKFKTDYLDRYEKYRQEIKGKWGVAELSSKTEYVHYNEENHIKVLTDFENDIIEVSLLQASNLSDNQVDKVIREAIIESLDKQAEVIASSQVEFDIIGNKHNLRSTPKNNSALTVLNHLGIESVEKLDNLIEKFEVVPEEQQKQVVVKRTQNRIEKQILSLENLVSNDETDPTQVQISQKLIVSMTKEKRLIAYDANELTKKNIKTYKVNLKRDRYKKAEKYLTFVKQNALKWELSDDFILAIIETESHFNPMAKSYIPAYGLMQIVPSTAGVDVNTKVLGKKDKPSPELLFSGEDNIKYGSAYIHILMTRYLKEIKNPTSRLYCAIASYNTGIGNVSRAFNKGKRGRLKAMKVINTLTPDEVYDVIKKHTHTETQRYLDKVLESKQYFTQQKA